MEEDINEIKKKKLLELQYRLQEEKAKQEQMKRFEEEKRAALMEILTPEARSRLATVKMAKPEFASQVELLLIQLAQQGQLKNKITDSQLKEVLRKLSLSSKKDFKIRRI